MRGKAGDATEFKVAFNPPLPVNMINSVYQGFTADEEDKVSFAGGTWDSDSDPMHVMTLKGPVPSTAVNGPIYTWVYLKGVDEPLFVSSPDNYVVTPSEPSTTVGALAVRGTDQMIYINQVDSNGAWSGFAPISNGWTPSTPSVALVNGRYLYTVVRGTDNAIYYNIGDLSTGVWEGWKLPTGYGATFDAPTTAVFNGRLYVFVRGTDQMIYFNAMNLTDRSWSGWKVIPGGWTPSPISLAVANGQLFVTVRGTDNGIWFTHTADPMNGHWPGWAPPPGYGRTFDIPATTPWNGEFVVFVRGTDNALYMNRVNLTNGTSGGWNLVPGGGSTPSAPTAAVVNGQMALVVRTSDNRIWGNNAAAGYGSWTGWYVIPGATQNPPCLVRNTDTNGTALAALERGVPRTVVTPGDGATPEPEREPWVVGDVNADGKVTVSDALMALVIATSPQTPMADQTRRADVAPAGQPDGKVTIADVTSLLRMAVGLK